MSNYSQTTFFTPKDSLPPTNPAKTIFGAAYDVEFGNIATAITSKADAVSTISSITGTANQIAAVNVAGAVTLGLQQNVIIPTPAAGTALVANGASTGIAFRAVSQGATGVPIVADTNTFTNSQNIQIAASGTTGGTYGIGLDSSVNLIIGRTDVAHTALTISLAGNVTISAPSSGIGLLLNTTDSVTAFEWATASTIVQGQTSGANSFFGTSNSSSFNLITNNQNRLGISNSGAVIITAPTSGVPLTVNGTNGANVFALGSTVASSTLIAGYQNVLSGAWSLSSQSTDGLAIGSDGSASLQLFTNSSTRFTLSSAGGLFGVGATGGDQGLGTLNATGLFVNGGQLFFGVPTSGSTTAAVTDVGKMINTGVNLAINTGIFSQGHILSVYNNSGSAITINGTIATMRLAGTATTGNRTLAPRGLATLWFESGAEVIVSGPGVS